MKGTLAVSMCLVAAALLAAGDPALNKLEIYAVSHAEVGPAADIVRALAGPEGHVTLDEAGRRLMVITTPENHARIADALRQVDVVPPNVRIEVEFRRAGASSESEFSVSGGGEIVREDGATHGTIRIKPRIVDRSATERGTTRQTLLVASGREARLRVGETVPHLEWLTGYGHRSGYFLQPSVAWQDVGSFLVVQPVVVGGGPMIRIRLTPELVGRVEGRPMETTFANVSTDVVVQDGQSFQIGGADRDAEFYSRFLVGSARSGGEDQLAIVLTPRIVKPGER